MNALNQPSQGILVLGIPRCGSTWVSTVLAQTPDALLVHEPDNEKEYLAAYRAKRGLGRFPVLRPGDASPAYEHLWQGALAGNRPQPSVRTRLGARLWRNVPPATHEAALRGHGSVRLEMIAAIAGPSPTPASSNRTVIVKSVHAALATDWLAARFPATPIAVVVRHPANVLASWLEMQLPDGDRRLDHHPRLLPALECRPDLDGGAVARAAWQVCLLTDRLLEGLSRHADWICIEHETACVDPLAEFGRLYGALGLEWTDRTTHYLQGSDEAGSGYQLHRRRAEQPEKWRQRLARQDIAVLATTAANFPRLHRWTGQLAGATSD